MHSELVLDPVLGTLMDPMNRPTEAMMNPQESPLEPGLRAVFDRSREDRLIARIEPKPHAVKVSKQTLYARLTAEPERTKKSRFWIIKSSHGCPQVAGGTNQPMPGAGTSGSAFAVAASSAMPVDAASSPSFALPAPASLLVAATPPPTTIDVPLAGCLAISERSVFTVLAARLDAVCVHYRDLTGKHVVTMETQRFGQLIREHRVKFVFRAHGRVYSGNTVMVKDDADDDASAGTKKRGR